MSRESISATMLWVMCLGWRPDPMSGMTQSEKRMAEHYRLGLHPNYEVARRAYLAKRCGVGGP